jgi:hypothetical protein
MSTERHAGKRGKRNYASSVPGDRDPDRAGREPEAGAKDVQPGTGKPGKSWQSNKPEPANDDEKLNEALKDSFPASDPPQAAQPGVTGWDLTDEEKKKSGKG